MLKTTDLRGWGSGRTIFARVIAAIPLNYALTALGTACLARLLPMRPEQASIAATLASFAIFAVLVIIVFAARSIARLWAVMTGAGLLMGAVLWLSIALGGRL